MPIELRKAAEIIGLNLMETRGRMPPDVRESLNVAVECIALVCALRVGAEACVLDKLEHETGYVPPTWPENHEHPGQD